MGFIKIEHLRPMSKYSSYKLNYHQPFIDTVLTLTRWYDEKEHSESPLWRHLLPEL